MSTEPLDPDPPEDGHTSFRDRLRQPLALELWHGYALSAALGLVLALMFAAGVAGSLYLRGQSQEETRRNAEINRAQSRALANLKRIQALEQPPTDREVAAAAGRALAACARNTACRNAFRGAIRRSRLRPSDVPALTPDDSAPGDTGSGGGSSGSTGGGGTTSPGSSGAPVTPPRSPSTSPRRPAQTPSPAPRPPVARPSPAPRPTPSPAPSPTSSTSTSAPAPARPPATVPSTPVTPPVTVPPVPLPVPGLPSACSPVVTPACPSRVARELARGRVPDAIEEARRDLPRCEDVPALLPPACRTDHSGPG